MKQIVRAGLRSLDSLIVASALACRWERPALLGFVFHQLFEDAREAERGAVDLHQPLLVGDFERFVEYFLEHDYRFIDPSQILGGLGAGGRYVLATFDDGYRSALRAIPVMRTFGVPVTFFISTRHVADGKAFWWDVLARERRARGVSEAAIRREKEALLQTSWRDSEAYVVARFGDRALRPIGDTDRPMTARELLELAQEPLATLGNHTANHAILPGLDDADVKSEIRGCQQYLAGLTGRVPEIMAYPNGDYADHVVRIARAEGLRLGVTVTPHKNRLPLAGPGAMTIGRYRVGRPPALAGQLRSCRSDIQPLYALDRLRRAARRHRTHVVSIVTARSSISGH